MSTSGAAVIENVHVDIDGRTAASIISPPEIKGGIACKLEPTEKSWCIDQNEAVAIKFSEDRSSIKGKPAKSVMQLMGETVTKYGQRAALKVEREGVWLEWTYDEYMADVKTAAKAFISLGLDRGRAVGILGFNSPEWVISDLAAIFAGGLACGLYTTNNAEACHYVASDAGCNIMVVENDTQLKKILQVWGDLPDLKCIVQYTGEISEPRDNIYTWEQLMSIGKKEDDTQLQERMSGQAPNKCCTLIYTSGTTGNPKGVMTSHDNFIQSAQCIFQTYGPWLSSGSYQDVFVSYLPLSHAAAQCLDIWCPLTVGAVVWFARPDALKGTLGITLKVARPTVFFGVPRVFEKIEEKMKSIGATITGVRRTIATWAKGVALRGNRRKMAGGRSWSCGWWLAHVIVLNRVRRELGLDRAKLVFTGAAPTSKQTFDYFLSLDIPLLEIYGLSETSGAVTVNTPNMHRQGAIGQLFMLNEYRIDDPDEEGNGELQYRGRNVFMGYLNNAEKTCESLDHDGWLHTGDIGKRDQDGYFYITGRIKELIITAGGENVAPVPIEDNIKLELPFVSAVMVIGDQRKFLSALLTLQVEIDLETGAATDELSKAATSYFKHELCMDVTLGSEVAPNVNEKLAKLIDNGITKANLKAVSNAAKVQKWKLLPTDFTVTGGELGPTQKLRRPQVVKIYGELIDQFYES